MSNVVNDVNGCGAHTKPLLKLLTSQSGALGRLAFRDFYTNPSRFERSKPVDESGREWMKVDENR